MHIHVLEVKGGGGHPISFDNTVVSSSSSHFAIVAFVCRAPTQLTKAKTGTKLKTSAVYKFTVSSGN